MPITNYHAIKGICYKTTCFVTFSEKCIKKQLISGFFNENQFQGHDPATVHI